MREEFNARVAASGLSAGAFIKQAIFGAAPPRQSRRPPVQTQQLASLLSRAAEMNERLAEIERLAARCGQDVRAPVEDAAGQIAELRAAVFMALGRSP